MKGFVGGVLASMAFTVLVAIFIGMTGRISVREDIRPNSLEKGIAMRVRSSAVGSFPHHR